MSPIEKSTMPSVAVMLFRTVAVLGTLSAALILLAFLSNHAPELVGVVLLIALIFSLAHYLLAVGRRIDWPSRRVWMRYVRNCRRIFVVSSAARFGYGITILFALVSTLIGSTLDWTWLYTVSGPFIALLLIVSSTLDFWLRLRWTLKYNWVRKFFLVFFSFTGALTLFVARELAQHLTQYLAKVDPKNFPDFVNLATTITYPLAFIAVVGTILLCLTAAQYALALLVAILGFIRNHAKTLLPWNNTSQSRKYSPVMRLILGKNPRRGRPFWFDMWDSACLITRPAATTMLVVVLIVTPIKLYSLLANQIESGLSYALAYTEYRLGSSCKGISDSARIAYLENEEISIATQENGRFVFRKSKCEAEE